MRILISPFSPKIAADKPNPKDYPFWQQLIDLLVEQGHQVEQISVHGEKRLENTRQCHVSLSFENLEILLEQQDLWISVDNFFPHFIHTLQGAIPGIVLWGQSDPLLFGYEENYNLIKDRIHLRPSQYDVWTNTPYFTECFVQPEVVIKTIKEHCNG